MQTNSAGALMRTHAGMFKCVSCIKTCRLRRLCSDDRLQRRRPEHFDFVAAAEQPTKQLSGCGDRRGDPDLESALFLFVLNALRSAQRTFQQQIGDIATRANDKLDQGAIGKVGIPTMNLAIQIKALRRTSRDIANGA